MDIVPVTDHASRERFIRLPWMIYGDDPHWIPPLLKTKRDHLDPKKNPYLARAETGLWLALKDGHAVGRISTQIDPLYLQTHNDQTGHFGMLEALDDVDVFQGLLETAENWLRSRGMTRLCGPFSFSINDECGLLVDGFDTPPAQFMGHAWPYYGKQIETAGYRKAKDLICYDYDLSSPLPDVGREMIARSKVADLVTLRSVRPNKLTEDVAILFDIFNDAWSQNWGFVPFTAEEIAYLTTEMKLLLRPALTIIAELDGEPVAMGAAFPNLNEAIADLDGRLFPFGWMKLLWRLKFGRFRTVRLPLLGVRRDHQGTVLGAAVALYIIDTLRTECQRLGVERGELSWILENNIAIRRIIEIVGGVPYKTYRLYEKSLSATNP